jgi:geranylgeranyl transferase type-2 subunit alpha
MHGRKRVDGPIDPLIISASKKKAEAYRGLSRLAFKQSFGLESFSLSSALAALLGEGSDVSAQLLSLNPELYSLWNHRRRLIIRVSTSANTDGTETPSTESSKTNEDSASSSNLIISSAKLLERELVVTEAAIKKNPKSYHAWHHRRWSLTTLCGLGSTSTSLLIPNTSFFNYASQELSLSENLFILDERNFHCWNYRRWIADSLAAQQTSKDESLRTELEYTLSCIHRNFSNYSAWHQRSCLLAQRASPFPVSFPDLVQELALVRKAVFTEPDDQSPWFYRRWVIAEFCKHLAVEVVNKQFEQIRSTLVEDCAHLQTLIEAEPRCRWPVSALVHTQQVFDSYTREKQASSLLGGDVTLEHLIHKLIDLDPLRVRYYEHLL